MAKCWQCAITTATILISGCLPAAPRGTFEGPVAVSVVAVLDGDTFLADAHVWPGSTVRTNVRIRGIDAPEMRGRCDGERDAAHAARDALAGLVSGRRVEIRNIGGAKYYGRVLADVYVSRGSVAERLVAARLVRPYSGGRRQSWCG